MKITVHHPSILGNGTYTTFSGTDVDYRVEDDGCLRIIKWTTDTETGDALFTPGQWQYVCRSKLTDRGED